MREDDRPTEPVLASPNRLALREEALPGHLSPTAVRLHREVRRRLRELDMARTTSDVHLLAAELGRATASLRELLASHFPLGSTRCPTCRTRFGRPVPWPCHIWRATQALLATQPGSKEPPSAAIT